MVNLLMKCGLFCLILWGTILADPRRPAALSLWLSLQISGENNPLTSSKGSFSGNPAKMALFYTANTALYAAATTNGSSKSHPTPMPEFTRMIPPKSVSGLLDPGIVYSRNLAWVVIGMVHRWQREGSVPPNNSEEIQLVNAILSTAARGRQADEDKQKINASSHQWKFPTAAMAWWYAAARMTWRITGDTRYFVQSQKFGDYVKSTYSPRDTVFLAGHKDMVSIEEIGRYVNMAQILPIPALGADTLDAWFGHNTGFTLLQKWIRGNARLAPDSVMTVHMGPQQPVDVEATAITALACRMAGKFYRFKNPAAAQLLMNWEANLQRALADPQITPQRRDSTGLAYFRAPGDTQPDLTTTAWVLFALAGQNPLDLPLLDPALEVSRTEQWTHEKTIWLKVEEKIFKHVIRSDHPDPEVLEIFDPLGNRVPVQYLKGDDRMIVELLNNRSGLYFLLVSHGNVRTRIERVAVQ